jgi:hypothetical protein
VTPLPSARPLRFVRPAPGRELAPERAAEATVLVQLVEEQAARVRGQRRKPDGWVPVHLGISARTRTDGKTRWLDGEHASHWAWPDLEEAKRAMGTLRQPGTTTLVLRVWSPVWSPGANEVVIVGPPQHHDPFVRSLCWALLAEDVPEAWARRGKCGTGLEWRAAASSDAEHHLVR